MYIKLTCLLIPILFFIVFTSEQWKELKRKSDNSLNIISQVLKFKTIFRF